MSTPGHRYRHQHQTRVSLHRDSITFPVMQAKDVPTRAKEIGVSDRTLWKYIATGELRSFKLGRRRLVSDDAMRDFIASREQIAG